MKRTKNEISIVILGAGAAGLCQAIKLQKAGFTNITILEKAADLGGTWRENSYPGCSCDVPMHMYQFSFAMNPHWSKKFVPASEIKTYMDWVANKFDLKKYIRYNKEIVSAHFNQASGQWELELADGQKCTANVFIAGAGQLHHLQFPNIQGQDTFKGPNWHSGKWNHDINLKGKRVGVIGNGASAIQFVPEIAKQIGADGTIEIFQRSASWVLPRPQRAFKSMEQWLYRLVPWAMNLQRYKIYWQGELMWIAFHKKAELIKEMAQSVMDLHVLDETKKQKLTPDYEPGCKRVLFSTDWWPAMGQDNIQINTNPINAITPSGVKTSESEVPVDVLIYGTGFNTTTFLGPMKMTGLAHSDLRQKWAAGAESYLGMSVHGFPNFFMLYGPNTNLGHNSILFMLECQANYITQCVRHLYKKNLLYMDVRKDTQAAFNEKVQADNANSVFSSGCTSWYKTADGKVTNNWANHTFVYWWKVRKLKPQDYHGHPRGPVPSMRAPVGAFSTAT